MVWHQVSGDSLSKILKVSVRISSGPRDLLFFIFHSCFWISSMVISGTGPSTAGQWAPAGSLHSTAGGSIVSISH